MNINVKPTILTAPDYHDFQAFCDNVERLTGAKFDYIEIEPAHISHEDFYRAIVWPEGAEDELFEFIFTNEEAWNILMKE